MLPLACDTTVEAGADFNIADIVFDANFFYCRVEPMLFAESCGPGSGAGESSASCHHTQTSFRITDYAPLFAETCEGGVVPQSGAPPAAAKQNYERAQAKMNRDPARAPLLLKPTGVAVHPRQIFASDSPEAEVIREWATHFATQ